MKLNLTADCLTTLKWWVDASYGVHWDSKGHTGMMMSLGKGAVMSFSRKQKLNAGSSTEAELIGVADALGNIIWGLYFMQAQGFDVGHNVLFQDNKSTILLTKNGRMSASSRLKHIHHRFYRVKDKQDQGELEVHYEPTGRMWSDILTKAKQGKAFREFRGKLMNVPEDYDDDVERELTHPKLLPREDDEDLIHPVDRAILKKAVSTNETLTKRASKASGHRRSVLDVGSGGKPNVREMYDTELARTASSDREVREAQSGGKANIGTPYDTELARKVSKRIRLLRYLRDVKGLRRASDGRPTADTGLPLQ